MYCWCIRDNNVEMIIKLYVSITTKIMCHRYLLRKEKWMSVVRKWICWYFNRYALPVSTSFNSKQYRGRNCRAICFFPPTYVRSASSSIEFFVTVQRTVRARKHIDRERWEITGLYLVTIVICRFFESEKRERKSGRIHRAQENLRRIVVTRIIFGWTIAWHNNTWTKLQLYRVIISSFWHLRIRPTLFLSYSMRVRFPLRLYRTYFVHFSHPFIKNVE